MKSAAAAASTVDVGILSIVDNSYLLVAL